MSKMLEALQHDMEEEMEAKQAESHMRATAQERCAAAEEQASKLQWEYNQAATALQRKVCVAAALMQCDKIAALLCKGDILLHLCGA